MYKIKFFLSAVCLISICLNYSFAQEKKDPHLWQVSAVKQAKKLFISFPLIKDKKKGGEVDDASKHQVAKEKFFEFLTDGVWKIEKRNCDVHLRIEEVYETGTHPVAVVFDAITFSGLKVIPSRLLPHVLPKVDGMTYKDLSLDILSTMVCRDDECRPSLLSRKERKFLRKNKDAIYQALLLAQREIGQNRDRACEIEDSALSSIVCRDIEADQKKLDKIKSSFDLLIWATLVWETSEEKLEMSKRKNIFNKLNYELSKMYYFLKGHPFHEMPLFISAIESIYEARSNCSYTVNGIKGMSYLFEAKEAIDKIDVQNIASSLAYDIERTLRELGIK